MKSLVHSVLGTPYVIKFGTREELGMREENMGECKIYAKEILVCTEVEDCTEEELEVRVSEIIAHEIFHAYINEAGIEVCEDAEESMACFFMKNYRKMMNSVIGVLDEVDFD